MKTYALKDKETNKLLMTDVGEFKLCPISTKIEITKIRNKIKKPRRNNFKIVEVKIANPIK